VEEVAVVAVVVDVLKVVVVVLVDEIVEDVDVAVVVEDVAEEEVEISTPRTGVATMNSGPCPEVAFILVPVTVEVTEKVASVVLMVVVVVVVVETASMQRTSRVSSGSRPNCSSEMPTLDVAVPIQSDEVFASALR